MRMPTAQQYCKCNMRLELLPAPLLLILVFLLLPNSNAQLSSNDVPSSTPLSRSSLIPTGTPAISLKSMSTSFMSTRANVTSSTSTTPISTDNAPPLYPAGTTSTSDKPSKDQKSSILNYYFVFLALFGVLLCLGIFLLHRRKRRQKERYRNHGQDALARDLDGWVTTRRWLHGNWRSGVGSVTRREEGLNENGEAPPPYQSNELERAQEPVAGLTVPPQALSREGGAITKPPDYQETMHAVSVGESTRPNTPNLPDSIRDNETTDGTSSR